MKNNQSVAIGKRHLAAEMTVITVYNIEGNKLLSPDIYGFHVLKHRLFVADLANQETKAET